MKRVTIGLVSATTLHAQQEQVRETRKWAGVTGVRTHIELKDEYP